jgi:uncharacterized Zn-binding protein involved in type VI secretion
MAVTIHVNGRSNSLVHKGSMGIAKSTIPDVCKTPSPGGPVPIPYPIIVSMSSDLKKGTKTVKVDGKNMAAIKGSEFSRCTGDEPGTAGGVKSSTNMKEATWILYSFDVKLDGKNACRLSDKMMMNHGNTACLSGEFQIVVYGPRTQHPNQTCADKVLNSINAQKKKIKDELGGNTGNPKDKRAMDLAKKTQTRSLKLKKKYIKAHGCELLRKRRDLLVENLEIRKVEQATCFHDGPVPGDEESIKKYDDHVKQINEAPTGIKQMNDLIELC